MIIRHLVYLSLKQGADKIVKKDMEELLTQIDGVKNFYFGEQKNSQYNYYFFIDFKDEISRDQYLNNAQHKKIAEKIVRETLNGEIKDAVFVFDYEKKEKSAANYNESRNNDSYYFFFKKGERESQKNNVSHEGLSHGYKAFIKIKEGQFTVEQEDLLLRKSHKKSF